MDSRVETSPWRVARAALAQDLDAEERRAQPELARQNVDRFVALEPLLLLGHALAVASTLPWQAGSELRWGLLAMHAATVAVNGGLLAVAVRAKRHGAAYPAWFGDATVLLYCAFGLAVTTSSQQLGASADFLNFALFSTAVLFRARLSTAIAAYLGATGAFWVALELVQHAVDARRAIGLTTTVVALVAFGFSRLLVRTDLLAVAARRLIADQKGELEAQKAELEVRKDELERLNEALERKVELQLGEIIHRSQQVEDLDAQLRLKVRDRAKDLVRALRAAPARTDTPLVAGTRFAGRVVIRRMLGAGGMGEVYLGEDQVTGRQVAVKRMRADGRADAGMLSRFAGEAAAVSAVDHPGVVRCLHVDATEDGGLYHLMEYVRGSTLQQVQQAGPIDAGLVARLGEGIASVLAAAHDAGVVHRDIKPGNVMLTADGPGVRVLDFGISKVQDAPTEATGTGQVIGTPRYMAPEQFQEGATISGAADVYALGLLLFELIAGEPPFKGTSFFVIARAQLDQAPVSLREVASDVPEALCALVAECLEKAPERRPAAREVERRLRQIADELAVPSIEVVAAELAQADRLRAAFDLDTVVHELAHAIARPPQANRARPSAAPTATAPTAAVRQR